MSKPQIARPEPGLARDAYDWLFRNRQTGRFTMGQFPNIPIFVFVGATWVRITSPVRARRTTAEAVGAVAITTWAVQEITSGVNPYRRIMGVLSLIGIGATVVAVSRAAQK